MLTLHIRRLDAEELVVGIDEGATVLDLKRVISERSCREEGVPLEVERQRLIFQGRVLPDDWTLARAGVVDGHAIHLVMRHVGASSSVVEDVRVGRDGVGNEDPLQVFEAAMREPQQQQEDGQPRAPREQFLFGSFQLGPELGDGNGGPLRVRPGIREVSEMVASLLASIGVPREFALRGAMTAVAMAMPPSDRDTDFQFLQAQYINSARQLEQMLPNEEAHDPASPQSLLPRPSQGVRPALTELFRSLSQGLERTSNVLRMRMRIIEEELGNESQQNPASPDRSVIETAELARVLASMCGTASATMNYVLNYAQRQTEQQGREGRATTGNQPPSGDDQGRQPGPQNNSFPVAGFPFRFGGNEAATTDGTPHEPQTFSFTTGANGVTFDVGINSQAAHALPPEAMNVIQGILSVVQGVARAGNAAQNTVSTPGNTDNQGPAHQGTTAESDVSRSPAAHVGTAHENQSQPVDFSGVIQQIVNTFRPMVTPGSGTQGESDQSGGAPSQDASSVTPLTAYANLAASVRRAALAARQNPGAVSSGPDPQVGIPSLYDMFSSMLNSSDGEGPSTLDLLFEVISRRITVFDVMNMSSNGDWGCMRRIRGPLCDFLSDQIQQENVEDGVESFVETAIAEGLTSQLASLDQSPEARSRIRDHDPPLSLSQQLPPIIKRRIRQAILIVLDREGTTDEQFPDAIRDWVDHAVGEVSYETATLMRHGWPDAEALIRSLVEQQDWIPPDETYRFALGMSSGLIFRYATDSYGRWQQRVLRQAELAQNENYVTNLGQSSQPMDVDDDGDFDAMVQEVVLELDAERDEGDQGDNDEKDLDELALQIASEAEVEAQQPSCILGVVPESAPEAAIQTLNWDNIVVAHPGASSIAPGLSSGNFSSTTGRTRTSSTAVAPRRRASAANRAAGIQPATMTNSSSEAGICIDIINQHLSPQEAAEWRRIIENDRIRQRRQSEAIPSRAYRWLATGKMPPNPPALQSSVASTLAETLLAGALERNLPRESQDLQYSLLQDLRHRQNSGAKTTGELYLQELESSLRSRVLKDSQFEASRFPATHARLGSR